MYGHRVRIGYCSPPFVTEVFAYEFYKMVPDGVSLMITTLEVGNQYTQQAFDGSFDRSLAAAKCMGEAGADVVVLGGNPVNQSRGIENLPKICADLAAEVGTKVIASTLCQKEAMEKLGVSKVATAHMSGPDHNDRHHEQMGNMGVESVAVISPVRHPLLHYGKISEDEALILARQLKRDHPETDCIHFASAHWPTCFAIDKVEQELGVAVMTSQQAIVWKALRTAGIDDKIDGFGRLFREF
jgi:maleate isomerase